MLIAGLIIVATILVIGAVWLVDLERRLAALEGMRPRAAPVGEAVDEQVAKPRA